MASISSRSTANYVPAPSGSSIAYFCRLDFYILFSVALPLRRVGPGVVESDSHPQETGLQHIAVVPLDPSMNGRYGHQDNSHLKNNSILFGGSARKYFLKCFQETRQIFRKMET